MSCWSTRAISARPRCARCSPAARYPARNPDRNISDLRAQLAACVRGAEALVETARDYGADVVAAYMGHVLANAEESVRRLLDRLDDGAFAYEMDNGAHVAVRDQRSTRPRARRPSISPAPAPSCPTISTRLSRSSAPPRSMSCARLIDDAIPMNDGCLRPITLVVPEGSMLNPRLSRRGRRRQCRNQPGRHRRLVRRHRAARAEPGDDEQFHLRQRRATNIMRRSPAARARGRTMTGPSAVQTHMTNSRLTDPGNPGNAAAGAARRIRDPPRLGRRGRAPRRRRRRPRGDLPRADARQHPRQPPPRAAARAGRRRRCAARPQLGRARRRHRSRC